MPIFKYTALDTKGVLVQGFQEAENQKHVEQILANQTLIPTKLDLVRQQKRPFKRQAIPLKSLTLYLKQLAMMLKTGMPIESAIDALIKQDQKAKYKVIWLAIKTDISEGHSLSKAMAQFPDSFPNFVIANVSSGEQSGRLDTILERTAQTLLKKQNFESQIRQALIYPIVVSIIALSVIIALLIFVIPQIIEVFSQLNKALPPLTLILIDISTFLQNYAHYLLIIIFMLLIFIKWFKQKERRKYYWDLFWLKTPLSRLIKQVELIKFTRTIATLLSSGTNMVDSVEHALLGINNLSMQQRIKQAKQKIKEGSDLTYIFESTHLFDPTSLQLIHFGQATGYLEQTFDEVADILEENLDQKTKTFLSLFTPLLILLMGVFVLLIVLAIMLPIFELNQIL